MDKKARKGLLFAGGVLLGVLAGAAGMMSLRGGDGPYTSSPPSTRAMGAPASTAFVTAVAGNCDMAPILPNGGDGDGRESLQARPDGGGAGEVASLILSGKEAAAAGRQRDAEIDFLNACRSAAALQDGDPIPLADAMYQLARHYATVAALGAAKGKDLFQRAERLYSASLEAYRARYGEGHEKTRFAQEGLITVQQATGGKAPAVIAKAAPAPAAPPPAVAPEPAASSAMAAASAPAATTAAASPAPAPAPAAVAKAAPAPAAKTPEAKPAPEPKAAREPAPAAESPQASRAPAAEAERKPVPAAKPAPVREARRAEPEPEPRVREEPAAEEPRPRPQVRRQPERDLSPSEPDDAVVEALPPRRPRPADVAPAEPQPAPDTSSAGAGSAAVGDVPQAEGSPGAP